MAKSAGKIVAMKRADEWNVIEHEGDDAPFRGERESAKPGETPYEDPGHDAHQAADEHDRRSLRRSWRPLSAVSSRLRRFQLAELEGGVPTSRRPRMT